MTESLNAVCLTLGVRRIILESTQRCREKKMDAISKNRGATREISHRGDSEDEAQSRVEGERHPKTFWNLKDSPHEARERNFGKSYTRSGTRSPRVGR